MRVRLFILLSIAQVAAFAQVALSVDSLVKFLRSSIEQKQPDRDVAKYVAHLKLLQKLEDSTIETLQTEGLGPKTVAALRTLTVASASLPVAPPPAPEPAPKPEIPPPPYEDQQRVIREMTEFAMNYTSKLPDFECMQVTRKYIDVRGGESFRPLDTVTARVAYLDGQEKYEVKLHNSQIVEGATMESLGGASSSGEFGSMMKEIFEPSSAAEFHWERWGKLRGKLVYVYNYRIEQERSRYSIIWERKDRIITGYKGLIYALPGTDGTVVLRVTAEAINIPPSFPVRATSTVLDYDYQQIGTRDFLLPMRADVRMRDSSAVTKNAIEFRMYRKFSAESTIKFDIPDELPDSKTKEEPVKPEK